MDITILTDSSNYGFGTVISHIFPDGSEKVKSHESRSIAPTECNYGQMKKEALATVFDIKKFHKMQYEQHLTLITEHQPLVSVLGSKKAFKFIDVVCVHL